MKRTTIVLMVLITFCSLALAQKKTVLLKDSIGKVKVVVSKTDPISTDDDSLFVAEYSDSLSYTDSDFVDAQDDFNYEFNDASSLFGSAGDGIAAGVAISIAAILMVFGFPIFIVFIAFYFQYKNRKAKYKLVEQALAAGQPIPESLFKENANGNPRTKGIKGIFLGLGLFIFLWAITGSLGVGCIGLLIMFIGIGEWLSSRNQHPTDEQK